MNKSLGQYYYYNFTRILLKHIKYSKGMMKYLYEPSEEKKLKRVSMKLNRIKIIASELYTFVIYTKVEEFKSPIQAKQE